MEIIVSETGASGGSGSLIEALSSVVNELWSGEIVFRERGVPRAPHLLPGFRNGESPGESPNGNGNGGPNLEAGPGIQISGDEIATHISTQEPNALHFGTDQGLRVTPAGVPDPLLISDGSDAAPSLAFASQPGLGVFRYPEGTIGITGRVNIMAPGTLGLLVSGPTHMNINLSAGNGFASKTFLDGSTPRWRIRKGDPGAFSGGSHFEFVRYDDSQTQIVSLRIQRNNGRLVLPEMGNLGLGISADANNALVQGSDNMFFVPEPADPTLTAGNGIAVAGLTISAALSSDANNAAVFGSDNGLFVPDPAAPDPTTFISTDADNALVAGTDSLLFVPTPTPPTAASFISTDAGNQIVQGSDNLLMVPATPPQIQGSVATVGDLPASGEVGQYYIVEADGNLYGWTAP